MSSWGSVSRVYGTLVVLAGLCLALSVAAAEEAQKDEKKGKIIQIDLSKLPPDVAKRIQDLIHSEIQEKEKGGEKGKKKGFDKKDFFEKKFGKKDFFKKDFFEKKFGKKDVEDKKAPEGKTLTLPQAIALAEKLSNGHAIKAERHGEGSKAHFAIEIEDKLGHRRVELSSTGEVIKTGVGGFFGRGESKWKGPFGKGEPKWKGFFGRGEFPFKKDKKD